MVTEVFSIAWKGSVSYIFGKPLIKGFPKNMTCPLSMAIERGERGQLKILVATRYGDQISSYGDQNSFQLSKGLSIDFF
jgi:hypothetical protein